VAREFTPELVRRYFILPAFQPTGPVPLTRADGVHQRAPLCSILLEVREDALVIFLPAREGCCPRIVSRILLPAP
jgi:hypothetical protein